MSDCHLCSGTVPWWSWRELDGRQGIFRARMISILGVYNSLNLINIGAECQTFLWVCVPICLAFSSGFPTGLEPFRGIPNSYTSPPHRRAGPQSSIFTLRRFHLELPSSIPDAGCLWACLLFWCPETHTAFANQIPAKLQHRIRVGFLGDRIHEEGDRSVTSESSSEHTLKRT